MWDRSTTRTAYLDGRPVLTSMARREPMGRFDGQHRSEGPALSVAAAVPDEASGHLPAGRFVRLPGRGRTFVRELAGPPGAPVLVLLHGWTATSDLNWRGSYAPLGRHFRVIAMDHRGHGRGIRSTSPLWCARSASSGASRSATRWVGPWRS